MNMSPHHTQSVTRNRRAAILRKCLKWTIKWRSKRNSHHWNVPLFLGCCAHSAGRLAHRLVSTGTAASRNRKPAAAPICRRQQQEDKGSPTTTCMSMYPIHIYLSASTALSVVAECRRGSRAAFPPGAQVCLMEGVRLLRGNLLASSDFMRGFVSDEAAHVCELESRLAEVDDPKSELLLLQACGGVCKLLHMLRSTPPSLVDRGVEAF